MLAKTELAAMLTAAADLMAENAPMLTDIDSKFGDGDHGITISKIADVIRREVAAWDDASLHDFLDDLGMAIMGVRGGSAGPLYGTLVGGLGVQLEADEVQLDAAGVRRMFAGCLAEMQDTTDAQVGDKTMMDALIPAVQAAQDAQGDDIGAILRAAADAAAAGAKASEGFASKYGRARSYGDKTIGTPDAGALSTSLFFEGLARGFGA